MGRAEAFGEGWAAAVQNVAAARTVTTIWTAGQARFRIGRDTAFGGSRGRDAFKSSNAVDDRNAEPAVFLAAGKGFARSRLVSKGPLKLARRFNAGFKAERP